MNGFIGNGFRRVSRARIDAGFSGAAALVALAVILAVGGCRGKSPAEVHLITPSFEVNKPAAPIGSPIEVRYRFSLDPNFKPLSKDYRVFVHFLDSHGEQIFNDDHDLLEPTSTWKPGAAIEYTRTVFIPLHPYLGATSVEMGLYHPEANERLGLRGTDNGQLGYRVGQITLLDQKESTFLVYKEGWYELESLPENPAVEWQWTKKEAVCSFKNPKVDSVLYIESDTNLTKLGQPLQVSILLGQTEVASFSVEDRDPVLRRIPISASLLGSEDWVDLRIVNSEAFVPDGDSDTRQLGLRVYHLYLDHTPAALALPVTASGNTGP